MKKKAKKIFRLLFAAAVAVTALIIIPLLIVRSGILPEYIKMESISAVIFAFLSLVLTVLLAKRGHLVKDYMTVDINARIKSMKMLLSAIIMITSCVIIFIEGLSFLMSICYGILPEDGAGMDMLGFGYVLCPALVVLSCLYTLDREEKMEHDKTRDKPFINKEDTPEQGRKKVYLAEFLQTKERVLVRVPCWDIETEGKDLADAISATRDAISRKEASMNDGGKEIPEVSLVDKEWFFSMVDVDMNS